MTTRFIGLKEFRGNMAKVSREAARKNYRLIVLRKNEPMFELRPLSKSQRTLEVLTADIEDARKDAREGKTYTTKQALKMLGL